MAVDLNNGQIEDTGPEDLENLLDDYSHFAPPAADEVLQGTVLSITAKDVIIDFGYKSEGIVPIEQFRNPDGNVTVQRGDPVDVMIDHGGEPQEGYVLLSHTRAARLRIWENLEKAYQEQLVVSGRVLGRVKGGLAVDVGIKAFMPGSQADPRPVHNLDSLVGQDIPVKIIKLNRRRGNVVVSRKTAVEEEINVRKSATLEHLVEGSVITGMVKNLTEYGAFIDLGGIDGLLHVTDISYGRVTHPSELLHVGDQVTVKILKFDRAKERVSLGMKQLEPDPWETVAQRFPLHGRVIGRFRRTRAGRRRPHPHQRDDLVAPHEASFQGGQARRPGGSRGPRSAFPRPPHFARAQAARA
jgi:small subunit ribosomal protein S1